jgi:UDP-N-acetylglucosamine 2-epimerase (non-hydrolysing)
MKTVVTITGIRPDFIRMAYTFRELDKRFRHILIHTGQHYDTHLSDVFFQELGIRKPDYILNTGKESSNHFEQLSYLSREIPRLFKENDIRPDLILFLGDSNSAGVSFPLKKEGYRIGHIEAGMRSYDKRMLEEINRTVCDHCSDILFVYHEDYASQLARENITENVFVVGNTVVEPLRDIQMDIFKDRKKPEFILMDIHRPENFKYENRLRNAIRFANTCIDKFGLPVRLLYFKRLKDSLDAFGISLGKVEMTPLLSYKDYIRTIYNCPFIISDSGTGQEEPALVGTPVVVPRDFTERPQSYASNCSVCLDLEHPNDDAVFAWLEDMKTGKRTMSTEWLGDGKTSVVIAERISDYFNTL